MKILTWKFSAQLHLIFDVLFEGTQKLMNLMKQPILFLFLFVHFNGMVGKPLQPPPKIYENFYKVDKHPGFAPFISHIDFRIISDFAIDQSTEWFDPDWVKQGDIIFVNVRYLPWFEKYVHDHIKYPYVLVSYDVGDCIPAAGKLNKLLYDPKCAAWFCRGMLFSNHPKLVQLPFGQNLAYWFPDYPNIIDSLKNVVNKKPFTKQHLLYMNHLPRPDGDRDKIVELFVNAPYCFSRNRSNQSIGEFVYTIREQYYEDLSLSRFVLSPLGLETDCVRTWEAFVLDCIPIVEHTFNDLLYEDLPVVLVHKWEEINEEFLIKKLEQLKNCKAERAYFDYWLQLIKKAQDRVRNNDLSSSHVEATQFNADDLSILHSILETKDSKRKTTLIYKGFLTTARSLQLAKEIPFISKIHLYDPWLKPDTFATFEKYFTDNLLLKNKAKISILTTEKNFNKIITSHPKSPIFLDLTYYRSGLLRKVHKFRHSLKKDIYDLYNQCAYQTLLCGNMAQNQYVQEVLHQISTEHSLSIKIMGNFWLIKKRS